MTSFIVNVADLLDREAPSRDIQVDAAVDWSLELSAILPEPPLTSDLTLSPLPGGILARGIMRYRVEHACRRCLTPYTEDVDQQVTVLFEEDPGEDAYPIEEAEIDLEPVLRDEALLALPLLPECPDGCDVVVSKPNSDWGSAQGSHWDALRDWVPPEQ